MLTIHQQRYRQAIHPLYPVHLLIYRHLWHRQELPVITHAIRNSMEDGTQEQHKEEFLKYGDKKERLEALKT